MKHTEIGANLFCPFFFRFVHILPIIFFCITGTTVQPLKGYYCQLLGCYYYSRHCPVLSAVLYLKYHFSAIRTKRAVKTWRVGHSSKICATSYVNDFCIFHHIRIAHIAFTLARCLYYQFFKTSMSFGCPPSSAGWFPSFSQKTDVRLLHFLST